MSRDWTEEDIAAWADGALEDEAARERIAAIVASDPEARALADEIARSTLLLRSAFAATAAGPVPPAMAALLEPRGRVTALPERPRRARFGALPMALAASVALLVGVGGGLMLGADGAGSVRLAALGERDAADPVGRALETLASGESSPEGVAPILSFLDGDGRPCREFEIAGEGSDGPASGIACRTAGGTWQVGILVAAAEPGRTGEGFAPASGADADPLGAVLDAIDAGPAMTPDEERALLARGWRSP